MNDYQMIHLATSRNHDFRRESQTHRLAKAVPSRKDHEQVHPNASRRGTLRLTLSSLFGRAAA